MTSATEELREYAAIVRNHAARADKQSRWFELFGTPERAAETLAIQCFGSVSEACDFCVNDDCDTKLRNCGSFEFVRRELLEWLESEVRDD